MDMPDIVTCWHCDMLMGIWFHLRTLSALILLLTIRESTLAPCVARLVNDVLSGSSSNGLSKTYWNSIPCIAKSTLANCKCSKGLASPKSSVWLLISPNISQQDLCHCTRGCCLSHVLMRSDWDGDLRSLQKALDMLSLWATNEWSDYRRQSMCMAGCGNMCKTTVEQRKRSQDEQGQVW